MALDPQRNWDVSMAENLAKIKLEAKRKTVDESKPSYAETHVVRSGPRGPPIHLPDEIILQIVQYISQTEEAQRTLAACCHLSNQWYSNAVPLLYERPALYGKNFTLFVRTICPSINLHVRKSPLSSFVRELDMGSLVHEGSKAITARLLSRTKAGLVYFRAPQASFAVNCLAALAKCTKLQSLDLSLVSEAPLLQELLKSVSALQELETFKLPRSSGFGNADGDVSIRWPPRLQQLSLSGGIDAHFKRLVLFPQTLRRLTIEHCPLTRSLWLMTFFSESIALLTSLEYLKIANMPRIEHDGMDELLLTLPQIEHLSISVDYITSGLVNRLCDLASSFSAPIVGDQAVPGHNKLHTLELTNSGGPNTEDKIEPGDVCEAIENGGLPSLRVMRVAKSLRWHNQGRTADTARLDALLQEQPEGEGIEVGRSGIWLIKG